MINEKLKDKLLYCISLQDRFNTLVDPEWKNHRTDEDWLIAAFVEVGELIESFDWKWWKKQERDCDNIAIEAVDILHFLFSIIASKTDPEFYVEQILNGLLPAPANTCEEVSRSDLFTLIQNLSYLILYRDHISDQIQGLTSVINSLQIVTGKSIQELLNLYILKNGLNELRQKYGYKEGLYIKEWKPGVEDNRYLFQLANQDIQDIGEALKLLEEEYKKILEQQTSKGGQDAVSS